MRLGGHVPATAPLQTADAVGLDVIQLHLSSPRMWRPPRPRDDAAALAASGRVAAVHAPYLCNPASADPEVRARSTALLRATREAAASVGAGGVVVHAGHAGAGETHAHAIARWRTCLAEVVGDPDGDDGDGLPRVLIEHTASGRMPAGRRLGELTTLVRALRDVADVGVCLDTAHAFAGDPDAADDPVGWIDRLADALGGIDVVHVNDSAAPAGSGQDRHANLGAGRMGLTWLSTMLRAVRAVAPGAPALLETPGYDERRAQDAEILRFLLEG